MWRWYVPDAIYFITTVTHQRRCFFCDFHDLNLLSETLHGVQEYHPFRLIAYAFMPDHVHLMLRISAESNISRVMHSFKWNTSLNYKRAHGIHTPWRLWQQSFYDHVIRDGRDLEKHFHYVHYNPIKHGLVADAGEYRYCSFREYLERGWYGAHWADEIPPPTPAHLEAYD
jgi:putative transposase